MQNISGYTEKHTVTGNSKCGFMKAKICLTLQVALCDKLTGFADEGIAGDVIYFYFSKVVTGSSSGLR